MQTKIAKQTVTLFNNNFYPYLKKLLATIISVVFNSWKTRSFQDRQSIIARVAPTQRQKLALSNHRPQSQRYVKAPRVSVLRRWQTDCMLGPLCVLKKYCTTFQE